MDHSETLQFEVAVICNPGVETPKCRKTPRKIPGLPKSPKRGYQCTDRELLGDGKGSLYAMLMLGKLRYDFEPDEKTGKPRLARRADDDGRYWVAYSLTFWERALGLHRKEVRSGIECLEQATDLVQVKVERFGNNDMYHFRLLPGCAPGAQGTDIESGKCAPQAQGVSHGHTECPTGTPTSLKVLEVEEVKDVYAKTQPQVLPGQKEIGNLSSSLETTPTLMPVETTSSFKKLVASYKHKKPMPPPQVPVEPPVPVTVPVDTGKPSQALVSALTKAGFDKPDEVIAEALGSRDGVARVMGESFEVPDVLTVAWLNENATAVAAAFKAAEIAARLAEEAKKPKKLTAHA